MPFGRNWTPTRRELLDKPNGKRWMTVEEAVPWAKRVWNVNILDETVWYAYDVDSHGRVRSTPFTLLPIPLPSFGIRGGF